MALVNAIGKESIAILAGEENRGALPINFDSNSNKWTKSSLDRGKKCELMTKVRKEEPHASRPVHTSLLVCYSDTLMV